jgi:hypothetical protein
MTRLALENYAQQARNVDAKKHAAASIRIRTKLKGRQFQVER